MLVNKGRFCPAQQQTEDLMRRTIGVGTYECTCCKYYNGDHDTKIDCLYYGHSLLEKAKQKEEENKIHRCWFCGSYNVAVERFVNNWSVTCLDCGAYGSDGYTKTRAIKLWNNPKGLTI